MTTDSAAAVSRKRASERTVERGSQHPSGSATLSRENLQERTILRLKRGGWRDPDVLLVRCAGGLAVVKDFAPRGRFVRWVLGPRAIRREVAALRRLAGHASVPQFLGCLDSLACTIEHGGGPRLSRRRPWTFSPEFARRLRLAVSRMHACGIAHLDLSHRSNVHSDMSGQPVLVDFASAVALEPESIAHRLVWPLLVRVDERALRKWESWLSES